MTEQKTVADPRADQAAKDLLARITDAQTAIRNIDGALNVLCDPSHWDGRSATAFRNNVKPDFHGKEGPFSTALNDLHTHAVKIRKNIEDIMTTGEEGI